MVPVDRDWFIGKPKPDGLAVDGTYRQTEQGVLPGMEAPKPTEIKVKPVSEDTIAAAEVAVRQRKEKKPWWQD